MDSYQMPQSAYALYEWVNNNKWNEKKTFYMLNCESIDSKTFSSCSHILSSTVIRCTYASILLIHSCSNFVSLFTLDTMYNFVILSCDFHLNKLLLFLNLVIISFNWIKSVIDTISPTFRLFILQSDNDGF